MKPFLAGAGLSLLVACASAPPASRSVVIPVPPPGRTMAELQAALSADSADERRAAAWELAGAGDVPPEVRGALTRMRDGDPDETVRAAAAWAVGHLRHQPPAEVKGTPGAYQDYDTPPRLVHQTRPSYPPGAYNQKIQGRVEVDILIDEQGNVSHAEVRTSIPALDAAALQTVREWRFQPAMKDGRAVPTIATAPVTFRIY